MKQASIIFGLSVAMLCTPPCALSAEPANPPIEVIGESSGTPPPPICTGPGCATVLSIRNLGKEWVPVAPGEAEGSGTYIGAADGIAMGPADAPVFIGEAAVDKDENVWLVTVRFGDGSMETIPQAYPPLFKRGDWVYVQGNTIQFAQ